MTGRYRTSTHRLAEAMLARPEGPVRGLTFGRFTIMWDGREGDFTPTIPTSELFPESHDSGDAR